MVWGSVKRKPVVKDISHDDSGEVLIADICVWGVWLPQAEVLFDVRVIDTDVQSYLRQPPTSVLLTAEIEKIFGCFCCLESSFHSTLLFL